MWQSEVSLLARKNIVKKIKGTKVDNFAVSQLQIYICSQKLDTSDCVKQPTFFCDFVIGYVYEKITNYYIVNFGAYV